jgi:hypothetical protein
MVREEYSLRGPVSSVVTERLLEQGTQVEELFFDSLGRLVLLKNRRPNLEEFEEKFLYDRAGRRLRKDAMFVDQKGGWKEIQRLRLDTWCLDQLGALAFGAADASIAETSFDDSAKPIQTVFRDQRGDEVSKIRYESGLGNKILSAVQSDCYAETFRVNREYDSHGQLTQELMLFGGELNRRRIVDYNEQGDVSVETIEEDGRRYQIRFSYEYDDPWNNWTRQSVHHSLGKDEIRRAFRYYSSFPS